MTPVVVECAGCGQRMFAEGAHVDEDGVTWCETCCECAAVDALEQMRVCGAVLATGLTCHLVPDPDGGACPECRQRALDPYDLEVA